MKKLMLVFLFIPFLAHAGTVKVGYSPVASSAGLFVAIEKGYFKEYGIETEVTPFRASTAPQNGLLAKGELDVGGGNITAGLWNANGESQQIELVADKGTVTKGAEYLALMVRSDLVKEGKFKELKDLKGLKMAFTALGGTSQEIVAERFLQKAGLTPKDVTYIKMPYPDMNAAFRTKQLDATIQLEPYVTMAVEEGIAVRFASVYDVYPGQPSAALFYSAKFAKERPEEGTKFMAAYLRGVRDYVAAFGPERKDRAQVIAMLKKYVEGISDETWEKMQPVGLNPDGYLDLKALENDLAWYKAHGYVETPLPVAGHVNHAFVDSALKLIGSARKAAPEKKAPKKEKKGKK